MPPNRRHISALHKRNAMLCKPTGCDEFGRGSMGPLISVSMTRSFSYVKTILYGLLYTCKFILLFLLLQAL